MNRFLILLLSIFISVNCAAKAPVETTKPQSRIPSEKNRLENRLKQAEKKMYSAADEQERKNAMYEAARLHLEMGNASRAVSLFNELLKSGKSGNLPHVDHYLGQAYYDNNDYKSAIIHFRNSAQKDPAFEKNNTARMIIRSHYEAGEYGLALGLLGKAARQGMDKDRFYYETASSCFYKIRDKRRSRSLAEEGLKKYPDSTVLQSVFKQTLDGT